MNNEQRVELPIRTCAFGSCYSKLHLNNSYKINAEEKTTRSLTAIEMNLAASLAEFWKHITAIARYRFRLVKNGLLINANKVQQIHVQQQRRECSHPNHLFLSSKRSDLHECLTIHSIFTNSTGVCQVHVL